MDYSSQKLCISSPEHLCVYCTVWQIVHLWLRLYANTAAACQRKSHSRSQRMEQQIVVLVVVVVVVVVVHAK